MRTYFVSFRIADKGDPGPIYEKIHKVIGELASPNKWWFETTSFYLFESGHSVEQIASKLTPIVRTQWDLVVIGSLTHKVGKVIGAYEDDDIFAIASFMR